MNKNFSKQRLSHIKLWILTSLLSLIFITVNSYAIKLTLNGQPDINNVVELNLTESINYSYTDSFRPIVTNTDNAFLCIGPNLASLPNANISFGLSSSDPFRIYGLVGVSSAIFDYSPPLLADKTFKLQTTNGSQCVIKDFAKEDNPSPGSLLIFQDSFETGGGTTILTSTDVNITLLEESIDNILADDKILSNANDFTFRYKVENIGDLPLTLDFADYFSISNNATSWTCSESVGADLLTTCGGDNVNPQFNPGTMNTYNGGVYLRDLHIENTGEYLIISVTRNPNIVTDNTAIDILASALVTNEQDDFLLNNSDTRSFIGNTNLAPAISNVADQVILEDSMGTGALAFTIADLETPAANLLVSATSSDQNIVSNANINIGAGLTDNDKFITVTPNINANTSSGIVTITLTVTDESMATSSSTFDIEITPVNDKPTFTVPSIADFPAGTSGTQVIASFIQNVVYGPTMDEATQSLIGNPVISNVSDPNSVLSSSIILFNDLIIPLSGQGGTVTFDVTIQDDGGTLNAGQDTSDPVTVSFTVLNTLPTISTVANTTIFEDNSTSALAFTISDAETAASALTVSTMSSDTNIVPISGIQIVGSGGARTVQVTPAMDQNTFVGGVVTITLIVDDGSDTAQSTFDITINPVNDAPSFSLGSNILWPASEIGIKQHPNYANGLVMGPTQDEVLSQSPSQFNVIISGDAIFGVGGNPSIDTSGSLAYVLNGSSGVATIQVSLQDDGSTANGGIDTSATQSFTITVQ